MERASDLDPTFADARAGLLEACAGLEAAGDPAAADAACRDAVPSPGQVRSPELAAAAAAVARARGDDPAAVEWMQRAVRLRPDDAELQLRLGRDLQAAGDLDAAEMAFHRAIDLRPDYWEGHYYLGYVEYVRGRFEATANAWRNAARCAPERASLFANLGAVLYALDRQAEALPMFERAVELTGGGNAQVLSNLGTLYFEDARYAEAASAFERAVAVDPDDYRKWGYLAWSLAAGLEPSRAAEPFRRAAELAETELATMPDDAALLARLAGYHGMLGNLERGLELVERAVALAPEDPSVIATVGETLEDLGERDRALEWIGRALDAGIARSRFESHPSLRDLVADPRFRDLIEGREPAATAEPR
jgi:tetratricopeptide (TPR) repeat protein